MAVNNRTTSINELKTPRSSEIKPHVPKRNCYQRSQELNSSHFQRQNSELEVPSYTKEALPRQKLKRDSSKKSRKKERKKSMEAVKIKNKEH